jgi:hypothetical protein
MLALDLIVIACAKYLHLPMPVFLAAHLLILLAFLTLAFVSMLKKAKAAGDGQMSGLQTVSNTMNYSAAAGAIIAIMFVVFHNSEIGRPLLNFSLVLYMAGVAIGMFAPLQSNSDLKFGMLQNSILFRNIIYIGAICTVACLLLRINHFAAGRLLKYVGPSFAFVFLIFLAVYAKFAEKRKL